MKRINIIGLLLVMLMIASCKKLLDQKPQGVASDEDLNAPEAVEQQVIAAYSMLGNEQFQLTNHPWPWGSLRGGDAYKGGAGTGDGHDMYIWETETYMTTDLGELDGKWSRVYFQIARVNDVLRRLDNLSEADFPEKLTRQAEMRVLRGYFLMDAKLLFKHIPYFDETIPQDQYATISNVQYTDQELWDKIIDDFTFGANNLPSRQDQIGRINQWAAKACLAKALLYAAYEQDDNNNVVNINHDKLTKVADICNDIIKNGGYHLAGDFAEDFLWETENGPESIFTVQFSHDDGTPHGRLDVAAATIYPMAPEYGCCGLFAPSQSLVNAYRTVNGLPDFDNYNTKPSLETPADLKANTIDPRLLHTVAMVGMPYKYKPDFIVQTSWARQPEVYGTNLTLKQTVLPDCPCFEKFAPFMGSSKNWDIIRLDDVMLWRAEALIQLGTDLNDALDLINQIRTRAGNSTGRLVDVNGDPTANFHVEPYEPGVNCPTWDQAFAFKALQWERRLEFATEGSWFFDLVRWGIAAEFCNNYFDVEKSRHSYFDIAHFTKGRDEYFPIPLNQINYSKGVYKQNPGY
jgi:hypothetical protein